jgi:hypothetical protein
MVHKLRINCGMMLGAWMGGVIRLLMKNRLLSLLISILILVSHLHFWPVGTSLFVFAWFIFSDSFSALFLGMILDFAVEAILPISVPVVSGSGSAAVAAL